VRHADSFSFCHNTGKDTLPQHLTHILHRIQTTFLPSYPRIESSMTLDVYEKNYLNKFVDHHAHTFE